MRTMSAPGADWARLASLVACGRIRGLVHEIAPEFAATSARTGLDACVRSTSLAVLAAETPERALSLVHRPQTSVRRDWAWFFSKVGWAEVAAAAGAPDPDRIYDELLPFASDIAIARSGLDVGCSDDELLAASPNASADTTTPDDTLAPHWNESNTRYASRSRWNSARSLRSIPESATHHR